MTTQPPATVAPPPASPTSPESQDLSELLVLVKAQAAKIEALESNQTHFVPMKRDPKPAEGGYRPPEALQPRTLVKKAGDETSGHTAIYDSPEYRDTLPARFRPAFTVGNLVRLNPDAIIHGTITDDNPDGLPWGQRLGDHEWVGEVLGTLSRTRSFEPKYRVHFQGLTGRNGDGFRESELLPA